MKTLIYMTLVALSLMAFIQLAVARAKAVYYCPSCGRDCDQIVYKEPGKCSQCGMTLISEKEKKQQQQMKPKPITVLFYLQDGVEVLDFAGPMEVFSYAGFDVAVVSKTTKPIISQGVLKIIPRYSIADAPPADILAFFGGNAGSASDDPAVIQWLKSATPRYYFSVCTGAFILGKAGLLDSMTITTFHESIEGLRKTVPSAKVLANVRFVDNGSVITTAGISAGIDGALHLVEKIGGRELAIQTAKYMEYDKWVPEQGLVIKTKSVTQ